MESGWSSNAAAPTPNRLLQMEADFSLTFSLIQWQQSTYNNKKLKLMNIFQLNFFYKKF